MDGNGIQGWKRVGFGVERVGRFRGGKWDPGGNG